MPGHVCVHECAHVTAEKFVQNYYFSWIVFSPLLIPASNDCDILFIYSLSENGINDKLFGKIPLMSCFPSIVIKS